MPTRPLILAATLALLLTTLPSSLVASITPAPWLHALDAPFTRSQFINVDFVRGELNPVVKYVLSNDRDLDANGHLTGVEVNGGALWELSEGDGPKTVYGQIEYVNGEWSEILEEHLVLDTTKPSSLYIDLDPQSVSTVIRLTNPHWWHEFSVSSPTEHFEAWSPTRGSLGARNSFWAVHFENLKGDLTPGTHALGPFDTNTGDCTGYCADVVTTTHTRCGGTRSGSFTINSIDFYESGDVKSADVDFRIICRVEMVMAGTLTYGLDRPIPALDQSKDTITFQHSHIGTTSDEQKVTFTNIGKTDVEFGTASIADFVDTSAPQDYRISTDECSGETIAPAETCDMGVKFTPSGVLRRYAVLHLPDGTARGGRKVRLFGNGQQPTTTVITVPGLGTAGPVTASIVVTVSPAPPGGSGGRLFVDGSQKFGATEQVFSNPSKKTFTYSVWLSTGHHVLTADYMGQEGFLDSVAERFEFSLGGDVTPPGGSIAINGGAEYTNDRNVIVNVSPDDESPISKIIMTEDPEGTWRLRDYYTDDQSWDLGELPENDPLDGLKTVYAKWMDASGNWSEFVSDSITYDTHAPMPVAPVQQFVEGSSITDGKVQLQVPLTAQDSLSGVGDYDLNQKTDTGAWKNVPVSTTGVSAVGNSVINRLLAPQHKYAFRVRATDLATNPSGWATGPTLNIKRFQESSTRIRYSAGWSKVSSTSLWGGAARKSTKAGASATFSFTGRAFAVVGRTGPGRGMARIYVNGNLVDTIDLYAASLSNRKVVWAESWATAVSRTIKVVVAGTSGRPLVELDAVVTGE